MNLFRELQRRNVFRVGLAYLVGAWLIAQVVQLAADSFAAPDWIMKMLIIFLILVFPAIIFFSWAYELTPDGLKRESEIVPDESITHQTARRLDFVTITLVVLAVAFVAWDRYAPERSITLTTPPEQGSTPVAEEEPETVEPVTDRSIAVLPFVNMSDDPENEYFADGLSEELLNRLAQLPELRVAGRTSSFEYKGQNLDLREIAMKLGVSNVLEGSVRRSGERVRITAQLIRASDGSHLWSQSFDRTIEDIFETQDEIAERVAGNLDVLMDDERREMMRRVGVPNVDAFIAYQKGWQVLIKAHSNEVDILAELARANVHFRRATELYPRFGDAWYWQGDLYQHILTNPESSQADLLMASTENDRILAAAAENAQTPLQKAYSSLTHAIFSEDWTGIQVLLKRALSLQKCTGPNWSENIYPFGLADMHYREIQKFLDCTGEPKSAVELARVSEALMFSGRKEEALAVVDRAIAKMGLSSRISALRVKALLALGRTAAALEEAKLIDRTSERHGHTLAIVYAAADMHQQADRAATEWLSLERRDEQSELELLAFLGRGEEANSLAATIDGRPGGHMALTSAVLFCMCGAMWDIEATPNFKARLEQAGLNWPPLAPVSLPARSD